MGKMSKESESEKSVRRDQKKLEGLLFFPKFCFFKQKGGKSETVTLVDNGVAETRSGYNR